MADGITRRELLGLALTAPFVGAPAASADSFEDERLLVGQVNRPDGWMLCLFNWTDAPQSISFRLPRPSEITDYWNGARLGRHAGEVTVKDVPPHSARLLVCA